jgi:hypothetical protein
VTLAEAYAEVIAAAPEARRPDLIERATAKFRETMAIVTAKMRSDGATDAECRDVTDAASFAFSDRLTKLISN